ncbi:DNA alkylation repair protein, partial [Nocardia abscessus]|uniref:DNA alkylation repair protein n=1 Tax=Nocardia abscessus TaxID=120957 RepID=UPI0024582ED5
MTDSVTAADVQAALRELANPADATHLRRFFKTGPGEYGEGDVFLGVRVPASRGVAKRFAALPLDEVDKLLDSEVHEDRFAALVILNARFAAASKPRSFDDAARAAMVELYLAAVRRGRVNNWDLVDVSAEQIVGGGGGGGPPGRRGWQRPEDAPTEHLGPGKSGYGDPTHTTEYLEAYGTGAPSAYPPTEQHG